MDKRQEVVNALKPQKKFQISWVDEVEKYIVVEASSEEEALETFEKGDLDWGLAEEGEINMVDNSIEIEEVEDA